MLKRLKSWVLARAWQHLFPTLSSIDRVVTVSKQGSVYINGDLVSGRKLDDLKSAVILFRNTELWKLLSGSLRHQAQQAIFTKAIDTQDLVNGKTILYTIDVQEKILDTIENAK